MMRTILAILVLMVGGFADAAPIPKALKKLRNSDYEGVWELTGYNYDGSDRALTNGNFWEIKDGKLYYGMPSVDVHKQGSEGDLKTPDESKPQYKHYGGSMCLLELNGDELKWIFCQETSETLTTCEPGKARHLYTFKRAK
jgi:hypothetical protein